MVILQKRVLSGVIGSASARIMMAVLPKKKNWKSMRWYIFYGIAAGDRNEQGITP